MIKQSNFDASASSLDVIVRERFRDQTGLDGFMQVVIGSVNSVGLFSFLCVDHDKDHDQDQGAPPNKPRPLDPVSREPPSGGGNSGGG